MKPVLTVIMPVYNTAKYLTDSINSVLQQEIEELEFIIVNDGSNDESERIIKEIQESNKCIRYFYKENGGQGSARNLGMSYSKGKYIYFMDSDDILQRNSLKKIIKYLEKDNLDAVFFDGKDFIDSKNSNLSVLPNSNYHRNQSYGFFNSGQELWLKLVENNDYNVSPCLYIIRNSVIKDNLLKFEENIINEDQIFSTKLYFYLESCLHVNEVIFLRRIRENSTMTSKNQLGKLKAYTTIFLNLFDFLNSGIFMNKNVKHRFTRYLSDIGVIVNVLAFENKIKTSNITKIKKIIINHNYFSNKAKLSSYNIQIYNFMSKIQQKIRKKKKYE